MSKRSVDDPPLQSYGDLIVDAYVRYLHRPVAIVIAVHDNETGQMVSTSNVDEDSQRLIFEWLAEQHRIGAVRSEDKTGTMQ